MRSIYKLLLAAGFLAAATHTYAKQNSSVADSVDRHLSGFNGIKVEGPFRVHVTQGDVESVQVKAPAEIMDQIVTEVDGHLLEVRNKHDHWFSKSKSWYSDKSWWHTHKEKIDIYITAKTLKRVSTSGSVELSFTNGVTAEALKLRVRGSGEITGKVAVKKLESKISGSGRIKVSGNAENSRIHIVGSGSFTARNLVTVKSAVHISGSGHADVNASDEVNTTLHGSAGVYNAGTAKITKNKKGIDSGVTILGEGK